MVTVYIEPDGSEAVVVTMAGSWAGIQEAKDLLKETVPLGCRHYESGRRAWIVDEGWVPELVAELKAWGCEIRSRLPVAGVGAITGLSPALTELLRSMPDKAMRHRVYLALVKVFHPDAGGATKLIQVLNDVRDRVNG